MRLGSRMGLIAGMALAAVGIGRPATAQTSDPVRAPSGDYVPMLGKYRRTGRGTGKVTPPKAKPNMRLVSKRTKRKHRRAAKR